jgi:hypothetical protein
MGREPQAAVARSQMGRRHAGGGRGCGACRHLDVANEERRRRGTQFAEAHHVFGGRCHRQGRGRHRDQLISRCRQRIQLLQKKISRGVSGVNGVHPDAPCGATYEALAARADGSLLETPGPQRCRGMCAEITPPTRPCLPPVGMLGSSLTQRIRAALRLLHGGGRGGSMRHPSRRVQVLVAWTQGMVKKDRGEKVLPARQGEKHPAYKRPGGAAPG